LHNTVHSLHKTVYKYRPNIYVTVNFSAQSYIHHSSEHCCKQNCVKRPRLHWELYYINYDRTHKFVFPNRNLVPTAHKTQCTSITKTSILTQLRK